MSTVGYGVPGWVDLASPDLEVSRKFYGELFGWTAHVSPDPATAGYTIFNKDGKPVAGAGPIFDEGQPPAWMTYVLVEDADDAAAKVEAAGGKVLAAPFDVLDQGRMAAFLDRAGAPLSMWQPRAMAGAELFNAPGALTWNELTTRDPDGSKAFYGSVFGWGFEDVDMGPVTYTTWKMGERSIGGMMPMVGDDWPADLPPDWMVYFAVEDCDASAVRAGELGGTVSVPPTDLPQGRFAVLGDPHGAFFSIIKLTPV